MGFAAMKRGSGELVQIDEIANKVRDHITCGRGIETPGSVDHEKYAMGTATRPTEKAGSALQVLVGSLGYRDLRWYTVLPTEDTAF